ncbi:hypothetical protein N8D56_20255 [Devosia sp. A8/3-2]|nr:hypothetical protein N8D56_20255 [Devosia sp. A8/3-2]
MPLTEKLLIPAMAVQVLLTIILLILMGHERVPRVMSGEVDIKDIAVEALGLSAQGAPAVELFR